MNSLIKRPYEISLWDDVLTFVVKDTSTGKIDEYENELPAGFDQVVAQYYKEKKIAIIGSDTMDTPVRAINPKLTTNINGASILTFSLYYRYYDEEENIFLDNPFTSFLVNERKVKVHYDNKWYDFVIKDIKEDSNNYTFTYTAKDLFVNELSKTGFNLEFKSELQNNIGTLPELAGKVLEDSDWTLAESQPFYQTKEEPLYIIKINTDIKATTIFSKNNQNDDILITKGSIIFPFYSCIAEKENEIQFLYDTKPFEVNEDRVAQVDSYYSISVTWEEENPKYNNNILYTEKAVSEEYRGEKFIKKSLLEFDPVLNKYVQKYENGIYGYKETEYISPEMIKSYITNPKDFTSTTGWQVGGFSYKNEEKTLIGFPELEVVSYPDVRVGKLEEPFKALLHYTPQAKDVNKQQRLFNSGLISFRADYDHLVKGQNFIFKIKILEASSYNNKGYPESLKPSNQPLQLQIGTWSLNNGIYENISSDFFDFIDEGNKNGIYTIKATCTKSVSKKELLETPLGLFISLPYLLNSHGYYIENVEFYPEKKIDGEDLVPGGDFNPKVKTKYLYYRRVLNKKDKGYEIEKIYESYVPGNYKLLYNNDKSDYEKERCLEASESNRFNLLQSLSELFNCWCRFEIQHEVNGQISLDENYRQQKKISFYDNIINENYTGFKYGINLKSISRTLNSDGIVSKIVVKNNSNEFAKDGFCSIVRSEENYSKENFILDFSHYIQQKMISYNAITQDLYSNSENQGYLGYYTKLKEQNELFLPLSEKQKGLLTDISHYQADYTKYNEQWKAAEEELRNKKVNLKATISISYEEFITQPKNPWWNEKDQVAEANAIFQLENNIPKYESLTNNAKKLLDEAQSEFENNKTKLESIKDEKIKLHKTFYKKYSRFIQEGSWINENYVDDTLYYLDAENTLHVSSQPKVSYNINVLELSQLEGYENYNFNIGDKTFIEDIEFFGWDTTKSVPTPYKEEIVVTEITYALDQPEQNIVKVQNYKTQFEDLFQRITATTQSIEYSKGSYGKAAGIVKEDGSIKVDVLQNSMINNSIRLENAKDQSVIWDETGITSTCLTSPNEMLRIISGGIFISKDGGLNWTTGISANGINANYITSGQIDTSVVRVMNGSFPSFRWDKDGLNAYHFGDTGFDFNKFVRFDQFGIYGVSGIQEENFRPTTVEMIKEKASFGLLWDGFYLKSDHTTLSGIEEEKKKGYLSITSNNDLQVFDSQASPKERVKIGLLANGSYGFQINDNSGIPVLQTTDDGKLWLKKVLNISSLVDNAYYIAIGQLGKKKFIENDVEKEEPLGRTIDVNNNFIVYEDGSIIANNGTFKGELQGATGFFSGELKAATGDFTGTITATGGKIGNLSIDQIEQIGYEVKITSSNGLTFKTYSGTESNPITILTAKLFQGQTEIKTGLTYVWKKNDSKLNNEINSVLKITELNKNEVATYSCEISWQGNKQSAIVTLAAISDGSSPITYQIESSEGFIFNTTNSDKIITNLTARIYEGNKEIDPDGKLRYNWYQKNGDKVSLIQLQEGKLQRKTITYDSSLNSFNNYTQVYFTAEG